MKGNIYFLGIILFCFSCEKGDDIDADRIYSYYELKYDHSKDMTVAKAVLRMDGPEGVLIELSEPAEISFNGDQLLFNPENKEHLTTYAHLVDSGTFKYLNSDGNTINTSTPRLREISFPPIEIISRSEDLLFKWIGDPVGDKETIQLTLEGSERATTFLSSEQGVTEFLVPASEIKRLDRFGSGTYRLQRTYVDYLNTGVATGGSMSVRYITSGYILFRD